MPQSVNDCDAKVTVAHGNRSYESSCVKGEPLVAVDALHQRVLALVRADEVCRRLMLVWRVKEGQPDTLRKKDLKPLDRMFAR